MTEQGKKVWKELEKMGWSNEPEDLHLEYFEDIIEATKKALTIPAVVATLPDANKRECNCSKAKDRLDCGFECYNK